MIDDENLFGAFLGFEPKSKLFFQCCEEAKALWCPDCRRELKERTPEEL